MRICRPLFSNREVFLPVYHVTRYGEISHIFGMGFEKMEDPMQNIFKSVVSLIMLFVLGLCATLFAQEVDFQAADYPRAETRLQLYTLGAQDG